MASFRLSIRLGNAAMESPRDVAEALRRVAAALDASDGGALLERATYDLNGNKVGEWSFRPLRRHTIEEAKPRSRRVAS